MDNTLKCNGTSLGIVLWATPELPIPRTEEGRKRLLQLWEEAKPRGIDNFDNTFTVYGTNPEK